MNEMTCFLNIWEIERNFKCPVIGAMLSVDKHKDILKKSGWDVSTLKPYEYHSYLMGCMGDENAVSIKTNNYIRHQSLKYMKQIAALYKKKDAKEVRALWNDYSARGIIGPVMYAIVSHKDTPVELLKDIHGEVHMLSHANMAEVFNVRRKLEAADQALEREKNKSREKSKKVRDLVNQLKDAGKERDSLAFQNARLKKKLGELETNPVLQQSPVPDLTQDVERLEQALRCQKEQTLFAEREKKQLEIQLFSTTNENSMLKEELTQLASVFSSGEDSAYTCPEKQPCPVTGSCPNEDCPRRRLCARRIFMIGGITKMKSYYRQIVEKAGGEFDYHDGYLRSSNEDLAAKVKRCDVVVCPVSCNSHNACLKVKHLCSRYNKELKILNSASLSAVTQALIVPDDDTLNIN
ncbi:DUF2325 domain-containing protein [uncultured Desulfobacter sp.]|uniref:DUF2325 domain-containing protein n=1 Tax=uncultured Desulfobacter sp. TaxID=240139 RepID=UPI002AABCD94|nr:DUF2325 domain-containing protein [uncultured Desulfobacter sp.]